MDPAIPSRTRAACQPPTHTFRSDQPLRHGDGGGSVDPRIRYQNPLAASPDRGEVVGSYRDAIVVWTVATGEVARILGTASWTSVMAWSPDGVEIVTEDADGLVRLDAGCGSSLGSYIGHDRVVSQAGASLRVTDAVFSPDGRRLYSVGADDTVRSWAVATGVELSRAKVAQLPVAVAVAPDGSAVVVTSSGGATSVHDPTTLDIRGTFDNSPRRWTFVDPTTLVGGQKDGQVISVALDGTSARERFAVDGTVTGAVIGPDGVTVAVTTLTNGCWLGSLDQSRSPIQLKRLEYYGGAISGACFSADSATVSVCDQVTGIASYDRDGSLIRRFAAPAG